MSDFRRLRLTSQGRELLSLAHQGVPLELKNVVVGNGVWSQENQDGDPPAALVNQKRVVSVTAIEQNGETAVVRGMLTNAGLTQGFAATEIGVTAQHPTLGEILYMADYCEAAKASYIPDSTGAPVEIPLALNVIVASSQEVTLTVEDRFFSATKQDLVDHDDDAEAHGSLVDVLHVAAPSMLAPASGAVDVIETPTLRSSAFLTHFTGVSHAATQYQVDLSTGDFSAPVYDTGALGAVVQHVLPLGVLDESTAYKARVRYRTAGGLWSAWSAAVSWTTRPEFVYVTPPTVINPLDGATGVGETPTIQTTAFAVHGGSDSHIGSQFQLQVAGGAWDNLVFDSGEVLTLLTLILGAGILQVGTAYEIRARHRGTTYGWSDWSTPITVTTAAAFIVGDEAAEWLATADDWPYSGTAPSGMAYNASEAVEQDDEQGNYNSAIARAVDTSPVALEVQPESTTAQLVVVGEVETGDELLVNDEGGAALSNITAGEVAWAGGVSDTEEHVNTYNTYAASPSHVYRTFIPANYFAGRVKKIKFAFASNSSGTCAEVYVGQGKTDNTFDFAATPVHVTFDGGNDSKTFGGTLAYSDLIDVDLDHTKPIVLAAHVSGTYMNVYNIADAEAATATWRQAAWTAGASSALVSTVPWAAPDNRVHFGKVYAEVNAKRTIEIAPALASVPGKVFVGGHELLLASGVAGQVLRPATEVLPRDVLIENLAAAGLTYTCDTADTSGHFSAGVATPIKGGCQIKLTGVSGTITLGAITGDGTAANAVPVSGAALALGTYAVEWIRGLEVTEAGALKLLACASAYQAAIDQGFVGVTAINGITVTDTPAGEVAAYAITVDGGASWQMWDGAAWRVIASSLASDHGGADDDWYSRNGADAWTTADDAYAALRAAVAAGAANQMASAVLNARDTFPAVTGDVVLAIVLWTDNTATLPTLTKIALDLTGPAEWVGFAAVDIVTRTWGNDGADYLTLIGDEVALPEGTRRVALGLARPQAGALPSGQIDLTRLGS
ncbi:MAG: hypothetical protein AB7E47_02790 [Desulfovibrionaceae bacterium]